MSATFRSTARWQKLRAHVLATHPPICGAPICRCPTGRTIDLSLSGMHRWGPTVDHIHEVQAGGAMWDETNLTPSHRACNGGKGNRTRQSMSRNDASARSQDQTGGRVRSWWQAPDDRGGIL